MSAAFQFSEYVLDSRRFELRRGDRTLKLEKIPMELLILLVERKGELVSRDEIVEKIWGKDVFLEADRGINTAVSKLRVALRDDPERPQYIQTVVGKGYRFIASTTPLQSPGASNGKETTQVAPAPAAPPLGPVQSPRRVLGRPQLTALLTATLLFVLGAGYYAFRTPTVQSPKTLAVLPFQPLSNDASDQFLELGMADTLITKLSRTSGLIVRPTSAIRKYTGPDADPQVAGQALQVDAVLEGTIQRVGDRLRVSARLVRVRDGASFWSESYDARFTDVFQVQDTVSERVVDALAVRLSSLEKASLRKRDTTNVQAYELYTRGIFFWNKRSEDGLRKAVSSFEQAIVLDNNYALAHAGLAGALAPLGVLGYAPREGVYSRARAAAARAVTLDPTLPEAHVVLGALYAHYEWNWAEGEKEFQRALELNSNLAWAHLWYGYMLNCLGRFEDALRHGKRAQKLDPITPVNLVLVGNALLFMGENERALLEFRQALELDSTSVPVHSGIARVYEQRGEYEKAVAEYRLLVQYSQGTPPAKAALGYALARAGSASEATQILHELIAASQTRYVSPVDLAVICVGLRDDTAALNWLDKAYDEKSPALSSVMTNLMFKPLLTHSRFKSLLQKMGLPGAGQASTMNSGGFSIPEMRL
jgi:TolB-like protein/DNA-binding winged helix-turn-helix (wHTH) protein/Tfp pilus assembly protein PilF